MTEIGSLLREARAGRSFYSLEKETKISHACLSRYESGQALPEVGTLRTLCRHLGIDEPLALIYLGHDIVQRKLRAELRAERGDLALAT